MTCQSCGNAILTQTILVGLDATICLVCQHTGRGKTAELQAHALAAALGATYAALLRVNSTDEEIEAALTVKEAQESLSRRIQDQQHSRVRPDLERDAEEERERQEVCQTCLGTRRYLTLPCPDCSEDGDRERD